MAIDSAGKHPSPVRVDFPLAAGKTSTEHRDATVSHADVAVENVCGGRYPRVTHDKIEIAHGNSAEAMGQATSRNSRPQPWTRRGSAPASFSDFHTTVAIVS